MCAVAEFLSKSLSPSLSLSHYPLLSLLPIRCSCLRITLKCSRLEVVNSFKVVFQDLVLNYGLIV